MKRYATFFIIAVMSLGLIFLLVTRTRTPHDAPLEVVEVKDLAAGDAGAGEGGSAVVVAAPDAAAESGVAQKPVERPVRVVTLGWELAAAGAALSGPSPHDGGPTGPLMELAPETTLEALEARLGRGGSDPIGADVAILPLPAFVVAYERMRALDPRAFMVVGFSHGREEVHATTGALLKPPAGADEIKLVAFGPTTASDSTARAAGSESATILGLFALDLLGAPPSRVRMVAPGAADAKAALVSAIVRGVADDRKLALSTADASHFIPIVAIAPKASQLDANEAKMRAFARAWLEGVERAGKDASGVSRRLAAKEGVPLAAGVGGAPEAIALLERLGQIEPVSLADQTLFIGAGAGATLPVTLETLAQRTWVLARASGLTTSAAPDPLPIDSRIAVSIAPARAPVTPGSGSGSASDAGAFAPLPSAATPLVVYRAVDAQADVASVTAQIGFLAGAFEHAAFRITAKGGDKAARAIATSVIDRYGLAKARLATAGGEPSGGAFASVEILALP